MAHLDELESITPPEPGNIFIAPTVIQKRCPLHNAGQKLQPPVFVKRKKVQLDRGRRARCPTKTMCGYEALLGSYSIFLSLNPRNGFLESAAFLTRNVKDMSFVGKAVNHCLCKGGVDKNAPHRSEVRFAAIMDPLSF